MKLEKRFLIIIILAIGLLFSLPSCKKQISEPDNQEPPPQQEVNPNKPNANHLILNQKISGDSTKGSFIGEIIDAGNGGFFFLGRRDNYNVIGKFDQQGNIQWTRNSGYQVRDILRIPENAGQTSGAVVVVGGFDSDGDGTSDEGKILLCAGIGGTLINEFTIPSANYALRLNTLIMTSLNNDSSTFVGFGVARALGIWYPFAVRFTIMSNGSIAKREEIIFNSSPSVIFSTACKNDESSSPSYFVRGHRYLNDSTIANIIVFGLSDSLGVIWTQDIVHRSGFRTESYTGRGMAITGGNLIIVGKTELEKEKNPYSGGYWGAGLIASVTKQGQVNWIKAVHITEYSESYVDCFIDGNILWVLGYCSAFGKAQSKRTFGYGLLSKVDPVSGSVLSHMSFGNESYMTGFNSIVVRGSRAYCVGYTNYRVSDGGYQSWFAEIDVSNPPLPSAQISYSGSNKTSVYNDEIHADRD